MIYDNEHIIKSMRQMAWERAKGEMRSIYPTFWSSANNEDGGFGAFSNYVEEFISQMEDEGLQE